MKKLTKNRLKAFHDLSDNNNVQTTCTKWENCVIKVQDDYHVLDLVKQAVSAERDSATLPFQQFQVYYEGPHSPITSSIDQDQELLSNASIFVGMHPGECCLYYVFFIMQGYYANKGNH